MHRCPGAHNSRKGVSAGAETEETKNPTRTQAPYKTRVRYGGPPLRPRYFEQLVSLGALLRQEVCLILVER